MEERNPSPPREFDDEAEKFRQDMIGETTISKSWVYSILMDMCKEVDKHKENKEDSVDVTEELQDEMCRLWDLCVDEDVANFLAEDDTVSLICGVISESKSPRLTEIAVGILGNMACTSKACEVVSNSEKTLTVIFSLLSCRDSPTLVEVGRLITTCLQNICANDIWLDYMEEMMEYFLDDISFILRSSTNESVLKNILEMMDICMDSRDNVIEQCTQIQFANCVAEAGLELRKEGRGLIMGIFTCIHIFYLMTIAEKDASDIFESNAKIFGLMHFCCTKWNELDDFNIADDNPSPIPLGSCLSIICYLLDASYDAGFTHSENFLSELPKSQRDSVCVTANLTLEYCKSVMQSKSKEEDNKSKNSPAKNTFEEQESESVNENGKNEPEKLAQVSSEETSPSERNDDSDTESNLFKGVPLHNITNDLIETLKKLKWIE